MLELLHQQRQPGTLRVYEEGSRLKQERPRHPERSHACSRSADPTTRRHDTSDRRYRSESGDHTSQQFLGTTSMLRRRSLALDPSILANVYSHMKDAEPAKILTSAGAGHRLGPKANTGFTNDGLRALDRTGAPCRKWECETLQPKNFTGVLWQLPSWRSPKPPTIDENGEVMISFSANEFPIEPYSLCKDQHGFRYLQRKLEERLPEHIQMLFEGNNVHVVELMTDPFGNYLCQKLLEYSNDEQCTALINNTAPQLVTIALNQNGTRVLQKMIEFISTPEQTQTVIHALENHVVELVQGLNGNHVIHKCLNRLSAEDSQFVYSAVGTNCVVVHSEGRISTDSIRQVNVLRGPKNQPQVMGLHLNKATQRRLILSNIRNLRLDREGPTDPVVHSTNLHNWTAIVKDMRVCTSCTPDRKHIALESFLSMLSALVAKLLGMRCSGEQSSDIREIVYSG